MLYITLSIIVIASLITIFTISFVVNRRTPIPAGCEDIIANTEKCRRCPNPLCNFSGSKKEDE